MPSSRALGSFFVVAAAACAGCSLLVSTSGFSDGVTSSEAGAQDATATTPVDASSDAAVKTDAAFVCDATFCDSFDDGPLGARWDSRETPVAATLALVPAALSAPSALELDLPARKPSTTVERKAFLTKLLGVKAGTVSCRFQVNVLLAPGAGAGDFALLGLDPIPTSTNHSFELKVVTSGALSLIENHDEDGGTVESKTVLGTPTAGEWALVELLWDFNTSTMRVSLNGASKTFSIAAAAGVTSVGLNLGETGDSDSEHFQARIDDFACTVP